MTIVRTRGARSLLGALAVPAAAVLLAAGCGTHRPGEGTDAAGGSARPGAAPATPSTPLDVPCPGESAPPAPPASPAAATPATPPTDHYAQNHGFMVPFPLHGPRRCDGLAAVRRVEDALEPLRRRGDFDPQSTLDALTALGYSAGKVQSLQNGPTGVGFLIDTYPVCVEGTMDRAGARADAFGGYPDHPGCDRPSGGH
jgi:hypothetical protein